MRAQNKRLRSAYGYDEIHGKGAISENRRARFMLIRGNDFLS
jgi:hypothetical protein